ncbi:hypothetical protein VNI00_017157 [Paramarasmius palmivorus]|uniref:Uncharacterized protein n=1 Tax=Paramarasmius palmivorus TaxID=297713 RepID=A0AAW0B8M8_9AGAR
MPPRPSHSGSSRDARGSTPASSRGGPPLAGRGGQLARQGTLQVGPTASAVTTSTTGVRRPGLGKAGRSAKVFINALDISIPGSLIYHYDAIDSDKAYPTRFTQKLIYELQHNIQPQVFLPVGAYDGKKNLFMPHELVLGNGQAGATFNVPFREDPDPTKPPKLYSVKVTKAAVINTEVLGRYVNAKQSQDEDVQTALTAINVIFRQEAISKYPFNVRSFFPGRERKAVGFGLELVRGYFQSVRLAPGRLILNVDITTGMFYKSGPLITVALEYLQQSDPRLLSPLSGLPDRQRQRLQRFLSGIRVKVVSANPNSRPRIVTIQRLTRESARDFYFQPREGPRISVADYFYRLNNQPLRYPDLICGQTASGAVIPLEKCEVVPGQIARKEAPPEVVSEMVQFSQMRPEQRMQSIKEGLRILQHGQSDYIRSFGMSVRENTFPNEVDARVIPPPRVTYHRDSRQPVAQIRNGSWNLIDKTFTDPKTVERWVIIIFVSPTNFSENNVHAMVDAMVKTFATVGMGILERNPIIRYINPQRPDIPAELRKAGFDCVQKNRVDKGPDLLLAVLPDSNNAEIYRVVKHFGDVMMGVATQCLRLSKCRQARPQYWANVALKVNPKLGGINSTLDSTSGAILVDPQNPTIVIGADVMHPAPGSTNPSYTALVGSIDSKAARYVAESRVQMSRQEIISDLGNMAKSLITRYMSYRKDDEQLRNYKPARILFFRDGVSEGQYQQVKDYELKVLKDVCASLNINPQITFIIVAKRHHFRLFPKNPRDNSQADEKSGNCLAGTVVETGITHPIEFDFYLQSHGGLLGTSRSAHYYVRADDEHIFMLNAHCNAGVA